ncbi:MAG: hypothetical protein CMF48_02275 [Legionellales bacterium]|nr:hypothetical protein [Legionellales bacterium]|tara:strand:+ start:35 stop:1258 length:1224 start_codon:yes stop_codon:yes gene_type:complete
MEHAFLFNRTTKRVSYLGPASHDEVCPSDCSIHYSILRDTFDQLEEEAILKTLFHHPERDRHCFKGTAKELRGYIQLIAGSTPFSGAVLWLPTDFIKIPAVVLTLINGLICEIGYLVNYISMLDKLNYHLAEGYVKVHKDAFQVLPECFKSAVRSGVFINPHISTPERDSKRIVCLDYLSEYKEVCKAYDKSVASLHLQVLQHDIESYQDEREGILTALTSTRQTMLRNQEQALLLGMEFNERIYLLGELNEPPNLLATTPPRPSPPAIYNINPQEKSFLMIVNALNSLFGTYYSGGFWGLPKHLSETIGDLLPTLYSKTFLVEVNRVVIESNLRKEEMYQMSVLQAHEEQIPSGSRHSRLFGWVPNFSLRMNVFSAGLTHDSRSQEARELESAIKEGSRLKKQGAQ